MVSYRLLFAFLLSCVLQPDIIAVPGDPLQGVTVLGRALFVMKGGAVVRNEAN